MCAIRMNEETTALCNSWSPVSLLLNSSRVAARIIGHRNAPTIEVEEKKWLKRCELWHSICVNDVHIIFAAARLAFIAFSFWSQIQIHPHVYISICFIQPQSLYLKMNTMRWYLMCQVEFLYLFLPMSITVLI